MNSFIPHYVKKAIDRLKAGQVLVRQCSATEEAVQKGDRHLYFTHPDGKAFPSASGAFVIREGLVEPVNDALLEGDSQTYRLKDGH
jgi:hypothetical protein